MSIANLKKSALKLGLKLSKLKGDTLNSNEDIARKKSRDFNLHPTIKMSAKVDDFLELYLRYYFSLFFILQITIKLGIFHWSLLILWRSPKQCWWIFAYNWSQSKGNHGLSKTIVQPTINITGLTSLSTRLRDLMFNTSFNTDFLLVCFICLEKAPSDDTLKIKRSVSAPKCQFSPAGQSLIQPLLEPFEHNLWPKKVNQKAIPAHAGAHFSPWD